MAWKWKLCSIQPFGVVMAQVIEEEGPVRHFRVRNVCAVTKGEKPGMATIRPDMPESLHCLGRGEMIVYPGAMHWTCDTLPGNEDKLNEFFSPRKKVAVGTDADVKAEADRKEHALRLVGANGE